MRTKMILASAALLALCAAAAFSQKKTTVFSSSYSSLNYKSCKVLRGGDGQDDAKLCPGPGGYQVRVYSSATTSHVNAELKGTDESFPIATLDLAFNDNNSKLEWRLANGKPFAVIMRVPTYAERTDGEAGLGKVTGQELVVIGLRSQESLSTSIDAKTPNANVKARALADAGYKQ